VAVDEDVMAAVDLVLAEIVSELNDVKKFHM
jgi:hypothetical protein